MDTSPPHAQKKRRGVLVQPQDQETHAQKRISIVIHISMSSIYEHCIIAARAISPEINSMYMLMLHATNTG